MNEFKLRDGHASIQAGDIIGNKLMEGLIAAGADLLYKSCANCNMMNTGSPAHCSKHNASPPASVIVKGCEFYEDVEEIPF